jgi:hypothetical protein
VIEWIECNKLLAFGLPRYYGGAVIVALGRYAEEALFPDGHRRISDARGLVNPGGGDSGSGNSGGGNVHGSLLRDGI